MKIEYGAPVPKAKRDVVYWDRKHDWVEDYHPVGSIKKSYYHDAYMCTLAHAGNRIIWVYITGPREEVPQKIRAWQDLLAISGMEFT